MFGKMDCIEVIRMSGRIILHIDLNSFFASVEQLLQPHLAGKPVAVAGNPKQRRGIVITCSYEARAYGVKTTMHVRDALRLCPHLEIVAPNFPAYRDYSQRFFALLRDVSPILQPVSIDEGYLDITDVVGEHPLQFVDQLQQRIYTELQLPCSIGVAPNKFLAKMASDMKKPMGITVLRKRDVPQMLWHLPVTAMHGVGAKTAEKLKTLHVTTIGQLAQTERHELRRHFGVQGEQMHERANGQDRRAVDPLAIYDTKSVGNSTTFAQNLTERVAVYEAVKRLSVKVAKRLQMKSLAGTTVSVMIRTADWQTYTRSQTVQNALQDEEEISRVAWMLVERHWQGEPIRLLGVTVSHVIDAQARTEQLNLFNFEQHAQEEPILTLLDNINAKYDKQLVMKGMKKRMVSDKYYANTSFSKDVFLHFDVRKKG